MAIGDRLTGASTLDPAFVTGRVAMVPGTVIDPIDLTRKVGHFNRTHDAQLRALLQPGSAFGPSDVQLAVLEPATNTLNLFADKSGRRVDGKVPARRILPAVRTSRDG